MFGVKVFGGSVVFGVKVFGVKVFGVKVFGVKVFGVKVKMSKLAVLVGSSDGKINVCVNDVKDFGVFLRESGYEVMKYEVKKGKGKGSGENGGFKEFLGRVKGRAEGVGLLIFYFTGHGKMLKGEEMIGTYHKTGSNWMGKKKLEEELSTEFRKAQTVYIYDCCRGKDDITDEVPECVDTKQEGKIVVHATEKGCIALSRTKYTKQNSNFTYNLITILRGKAKRKYWQEVLDKTATKTYENGTNQAAEVGYFWDGEKIRV